MQTLDKLSEDQGAGAVAAMRDKLRKMALISTS